MLLSLSADAACSAAPRIEVLKWHGILIEVRSSAATGPHPVLMALALSLRPAIAAWRISCASALLSGSGGMGMNDSPSRLYHFPNFYLRSCEGMSFSDKVIRP